MCGDPLSRATRVALHVVAAADFLRILGFCRCSKRYRATPPPKRPCRTSALERPGVSHVELPLKRCPRLHGGVAATLAGCPRYTVQLGCLLKPPILVLYDFVQKQTKKYDFAKQIVSTKNALFPPSEHKSCLANFLSNSKFLTKSTFVQPSPKTRFFWYILEVSFFGLFLFSGCLSPL